MRREKFNLTIQRAMATKGRNMKIIFPILFLAGFGFGTINAYSSSKPSNPSQDKPTLLYRESYDCKMHSNINPSIPADDFFAFYQTLNGLYDEHLHWVSGQSGYDNWINNQTDTNPNPIDPYVEYYFSTNTTVWPNNGTPEISTNYSVDSIVYSSYTSGPNIDSTVTVNDPPLYSAGGLNYDEHCKVTAAFNYVGLSTYDASLDDVYPWSFGPMGAYWKVAPYTRTADAVWILQTGGKATSHRQNLYCLAGTASEILDKLAWGNSGITPPVAIPATAIKIDNKPLGSDGKQWRMYADNTTNDVTPRVKNNDFYTFNVTQQKYKLNIVVNETTPLQDDRVVPSAYYCVGQKLNFQAVFSPDVSGSLSNTSPTWNYTADYINSHYTSLYGNCEIYNIAAGPAMSNPTTAWFYNKQTQDVNANLGLYCKFNNGQSVYLIRKGQFNVYRPSLKGLHTYDTPYVSICNGDILTIGTNSGAGDICYRIYIDTKYIGKGGITQLINGNYYGYEGISPWSDTGGDYDLDNDLIYNKSDGIISDIVNWTNNALQFEDKPAIGCYHNPSGMNLAFQDYIRFKPDAGNSDDNIYVTLGMITWSLSAEATQVGDTWIQSPTNSVTNVQSPNNSNQFPYWEAIFYNSLYDWIISRL
jgi:hypothetical protein